MADQTGPDRQPEAPSGSAPAGRTAPEATKKSTPGSKAPNYRFRRAIAFGGIALVALAVAVVVVPALLGDDEASSSGLQPASGLPLTEPGPTAKPAAGPHWSTGITCNGACLLAADGSRGYVVAGSQPKSTKTTVSAYDSGSGKRSWSSPLSLDVVSSLDVTDVGLVASGDDKTVVVDTGNGKKKWEAKGLLADVTSDGVILSDPESTAEPSSRLVDSASGKVEWTTPGALTACGSHYVAGTDTELVARDAGGHEQWRERVPGNVAKALHCNDDDVVAYRETDTKISVRSAETGDEIDSIATTDADLTVVVTDDGTVITIGGGAAASYERDGDAYTRSWQAKSAQAFVSSGAQNVLVGSGRMLVVVPVGQATMVQLSDGKVLGHRDVRTSTLLDVTSASLITGDLDGVDAFDLSDLGKRWSLGARFIEAIAAGGPHLYAIVNDNTLQAFA